MSHECHALGCKNKCRPEHLMCEAHWATVPESCRKRVISLYRNGQCKNSPTPSPEWHDAADVAIYRVAFYEAKLAMNNLSRQLKELGEVPNYGITR